MELLYHGSFYSLKMHLSYVTVRVFSTSQRALRVLCGWKIPLWLCGCRPAQKYLLLIRASDLYRVSQESSDLILSGCSSLVGVYFPLASTRKGAPLGVSSDHVGWAWSPFIQADQVALPLILVHFSPASYLESHATVCGLWPWDGFQVCSFRKIKLLCPWSVLQENKNCRQLLANLCPRNEP